VSEATECPTNFSLSLLSFDKLDFLKRALIFLRGLSSQQRQTKVRRTFGRFAHRKLPNSKPISGFPQLRLESLPQARLEVTNQRIT